MARPIALREKVIVLDLVHLCLRSCWRNWPQMMLVMLLRSKLAINYYLESRFLFTNPDNDSIDRVCFH
jgi:hypothetical protein